jgi:acyl carrier protein
MDDISSRLTQCFLTVFPDIDSRRIPGATSDTIKDWDSVAHISLLTVIDEEFGIETDMEGAGNLTSWQALLDYIRHEKSRA